MNSFRPLGQEAETKAELKRLMEVRYLDPETQEYKTFKEKAEAKREKANKGRDKAATPTRRPVKREKQANQRRLRLENRRAKNGRIPAAEVTSG